MKNQVYSFTAENILYIQRIKKTGKVNTSQGEQIQKIIREQVNPRFNMCTSCGGVIADRFKALVSWIETFIGCPIEDFNEKNSEGLIEKGEEEIDKNEKKAEKAKKKAVKDAKKLIEKEREEREEKRNKDNKLMNTRKEKREKLREEQKEGRAEILANRQEVLDDERKAKENEAELIEKTVKDWDSEEGLILSLEEFEEMSSKEIIEYTKDLTGIEITIDPKSKKQIIEKALTINNNIANGVKELENAAKAEEDKKESEEDDKIKSDNVAEFEESQNQTEEENPGPEEKKTVADYDAMKLKALKELCKERGIEFGNQAKEKSLIAKLKEADAKK